MAAADLSETTEANGRGNDDNHGEIDTGLVPSCTRIRRELLPRTHMSSGFYSSTDTNGKELDIVLSFSMSSGRLIVGTKLAFFFLALSALVYGLVTSEHMWFYPAYLTNWGLILSIIYFMFSTLLSWSVKSLIAVKVTWLLFSVVAVLEVVITVFFWALVYEGGKVRYDTVIAHAIVLFLVIIDGLVINRTPVRLLHWLGTCFISLCYVVWILVQAYAIEDNPDTDPGEDDGIYQALDWNNERTSVILLLVFVIFIVSPIIHILLWFVSLCGRRYLTKHRIAPVAMEDTKGNIGASEAV